MATRTQGLLFGCVLFGGAALLVVVSATWLFSGRWMRSTVGLPGEHRVGLIVLEGPITEARALVDEIEENRRDGSIHAVVLRIDSPGGEVAPSQELHDAIRRLAEQKPVVASLGSVAASGGYYVAVGADSIVADPGSVVGSIGVIFAYPTVERLMEKAGVEYHVYKSGNLKDLGSFARHPSEEEEAIFDAIVADVYDQFVSAVCDGRRLDRQDVLGLADGRIWSGRQAQALGLVDRLGDLHAATAMAAELGGIHGEPTLVRKTRPRLPLLDILDQFLGDSARSMWGPRLEYRLR